MQLGAVCTMFYAGEEGRHVKDEHAVLKIKEDMGQKAANSRFVSAQ